jgi:hypothetical protein
MSASAITTANQGKDLRQSKPLPEPKSDFCQFAETLRPASTVGKEELVRSDVTGIAYAQAFIGEKRWLSQN